MADPAKTAEEEPEPMPLDAAMAADDMAMVGAVDAGDLDGAMDHPTELAGDDGAKETSADQGTAAAQPKVAMPLPGMMMSGIPQAAAAAAAVGNVRNPAGLAMLPRVNFANFNLMMSRNYAGAASIMAAGATGKRKRNIAKMMGHSGDDQRPCPGSIILPVDNLEDMAFVLLVNDLRQNYDARYHSRIGIADNAHGLYMNKAGEKIAELVTRPPAFDLFLGDHVTKKRGRKPAKSKDAPAGGEGAEEAKGLSSASPGSAGFVPMAPEDATNAEASPDSPDPALVPEPVGAASMAQLEDSQIDATDALLRDTEDAGGVASTDVGEEEAMADSMAEEESGAIAAAPLESGVPPAKIAPNTPFASTASAKSKAKTKREPKPEPEWDVAVKHHWAFRSSVCEGWLPLKKGAGRTSRVCESCSKVVNALRRRAKNLMELQQKRHKEGVHVETLRHDFIARDPELALSHLQRQTTLINKLRREARAARQSNLLLEQERRVTSFKVATLQQTLIDVQKNANETPQKQLARHLRDAVPLLKHAFPDEDPNSMDLESRAFFTSAFNNIAKLADGSSRNGFRYSIEVIKTAKHYIHKLGKNYYKRLAQTILWPSKRHVQIFISKEKQREGEEDKAQDLADREREQSATDGMLSIGAQAKDLAPIDIGSPSKAAGAKGGRDDLSRSRKPHDGRGNGSRLGMDGGARMTSDMAAEAKSADQDLGHDALAYAGQAEHAHLTAAASVAAGATGPVPDGIMQQMHSAFNSQGLQMGVPSPSAGAVQNQPFSAFGQYAAFGNNPWIFQNGLPGTEPEPRPPPQGPTRTRGV